MSDVPELIEPVDVVIRQFDVAKTQFSGGVSGRKEVVNSPMYGTPIILPAQIVFGDGDQKQNFSQMGTDEQVKGYMVLRFYDTSSKNITLKRGDKIVKLGQLDTEYYFTHSQGDPAAHFSSIGGFTLFRMFFSDRAPTGGK